MKTTFSILLVLALAGGALGLAWARPAQAATIPTISIVEVEPDESVTIRTHNYPANQTFTVRMGKFGTRGVNGVKVGTLDSEDGGSLTATFDIPESLQGLATIAIRLESPAGYFSYNWFYNVSGGTGSDPGTGPGAGGPSPGYTGIPTISILEVEPDESVAIQTHNYPANQTFTVRMGKLGTRGVNGVSVGTVDSEDGGTFTATFDIPESLQGLATIAIRLESPAGYFSYNWFYNASGGTGSDPGTGPGAGGPSPGYTGIPTISIHEVVRNETVTVQTHNYPANQTFTVRMGKLGTRGVNGISVGTVDSKDGGTFTATFDIPEELHGLSAIAIRLESPAGYFSYNWFYNTTN